MSCGPARIFNLPGGTLRAGAPGDVTLLDLDAPFKIAAPFQSKASNSPFVGESLHGRAVTTIVGGAIRYDIRAAKRKAKK
jgi:dihydroorotase